MRIGGKTPVTHKRMLVLPRGDGEEPVVLWAQALLSMDDFEKYCPEPMPPVLTRPGNVKEMNWQDKGYLQQVTARGRLRNDYIVITSLKATPDLEWDKVKYEAPETWECWKEELTAAGFSVFEIQRVLGLALEVNSLMDSLLDEAQKTFLAGQGAK